ncbi:hypothetical protein B0H11DRAFT_620888 [Mycena galericulata]|nr:hypothetical protein B0H11DRAFT_620888 [Mycena galericulata]
MQNVSTPPRRKSIINMFSTPPLRRSMLSGKAANSPFRHPSPQRISNATGSDDDEENILTATGDISISHPYYVPGVSGALSPQPRSRRGTPHMQAGLPARGPMRPRPPMRRLSSDTYKFRTITKKAGSLSSAVTPSRAPTNASAAPQVIRTPAVVESTPTCSGNTSVSSWDSSIGSIADEVRFLLCFLLKTSLADIWPSRTSSCRRRNRASKRS